MSPRIDARQRKSTRLIGLVLVSTLVCFPRAEVHSQDCAPPAGAQKSCAAPARQPMCRPRSRPRSRSYIEDQEFERRLAEEVAAAVAEATLQSERERQGATGGATATAEFSSPPPSGVVAGATNSVGIRGLEVTFPEWKLALPSVQFPALVRLRRDAEMLLDSGRATLVRNGGGGPGGAVGGAIGPSNYPPGAGGVFVPFPAGTTGAAPTAGGATGTPEPAAEETRPSRVRRLPRSRIASDDEYEFVDDTESSCAPPPACAPALRSTRTGPRSGGEPFTVPSAKDETNEGHVPPEPPPGTGESVGLQRELDAAREELQATRQQIQQLTAMVAQVVAAQSTTPKSERSVNRSSRQVAVPLVDEVLHEDLFEDLETANEAGPEPVTGGEEARVTHESPERRQIHLAEHESRGGGVETRASSRAESDSGPVSRGGAGSRSGDGEVEGRMPHKKLPFGLEKLKRGAADPAASQTHPRRGPGHALPRLF